MLKLKKLGDQADRALREGLNRRLDCCAWADRRFAFSFQSSVHQRHC